MGVPPPGKFPTQVEKHHVNGTIWEVQFTDEDFHIDLNQELYKECLEHTRGLKKGTWLMWMKKNLKRNKILVSEQALQEECLSFQTVFIENTA